jgi:hypothetical protein
MLALGQRERLAVEVGQRRVGRETDLGRKAAVADVVRAGFAVRPCFRPPQHGVARHADPWRAGQRLDHTDQLGGPEAPVVLQEAWREIEQAKSAFRRLEACLEDVGVGQVTLHALAWRRGADGELSPAVVEQRSEDRRRVEAGHAAPHDGAVAPHMSCQLTIADESEVGERHGAP